MSQSVKNNPAPPQHGVVFAPQMRIAWWYGTLRLLPLIALLHYYVGSWLTLPLSTLLALAWTYWLWANNHRIRLHQGQLSAFRPFLLPFRTDTTPVLQLSLAQLQRVNIRLGQGLDQRQWLDFYTDEGIHHRLRCDNLHEQDPPEIDDHEHHDQPEHELFALLNDEDFYEGSLQHLAALFHQQGVSVMFSNG